jgi:restriction system protein
VAKVKQEITLTIPDYQTLMLPVLKIAAEGRKRVNEAADRIADDFGITAQEREQLLPSGKTPLLINRIHWSKTYLTKAGLLSSPQRGWFEASSAGRELLAKNPPRVDVEFLLSIPQFVVWYRAPKKVQDAEDREPKPANDIREIARTHSSGSANTPEEEIDAAYTTYQSILSEDLLERILQNTPAFFEQAIIDLLIAMGYGGNYQSAAAHLGRTGDGGVDGVINEDRLGLDRVYVQAKRYAPANSIGRPDVQAFVGSLVGQGATKGVFVTTSYFSTQATEYVRHLTQRVILIDGQRLATLLIEHNVGVRVSRALEFKKLDEDYFSEEV